MLPTLIYILYAYAQFHHHDKTQTAEALKKQLTMHLLYTDLALKQLRETKLDPNEENANALNQNIANVENFEKKEGAFKKLLTGLFFAYLAYRYFSK